MKKFPFLLFVFPITLGFSASGGPASDKPLDPWQWANRILLVDGREDDLDDLLLLMEVNKHKIEERHLLWFILTDDEVRTNTDDLLPKGFARAIRRQHFTATETKAVLVGKDGGVKMREADLDLAEVFARIDSMPMRQAEMK